MSNYWLELIEIEEAAIKLEAFIKANVRGRLFIDPKSDIQKFLTTFFIQNPDFKKYERRFNVKVEIAPVQNDARFSVLKVKVIVY